MDGAEPMTLESLADGVSTAVISARIEKPKKAPPKQTQLQSKEREYSAQPDRKTGVRKKGRRGRPEFASIKHEPPSDPDAPNLLIGMTAIAKYWKIPERLAYRLAASQRLPGCFKLSPAIWAMDPATAREVLRERARGACA
jgi:hypothetical protein